MTREASPRHFSLGRRGKWIAIGVAVLLILAMPVLYLSGWPGPRFQAFDVSNASWGRDFKLRDVDGHERTLADYRGKVVLLFFGFTQCPDVCPTALARAVDVEQRLGKDAARVQVLFVTLDPERDQPGLLKAYMDAFDPRFVALWGDLPTTDATAREFKIAYRKVPTGSSYTLDHTAITYAFDARGRLRLAIPHAQPAAAVAKDVERLLDES